MKSPKKIGIATLSLLALSACVTATASAGDKKDIVDIAVGAGKFKTLVAAVKAAGLVETLKGKGPFTVFAPSDKAFAKLPKGTVEKLLNEPGRKTLKKILLHHVVPGKVMASDVVKLSNAKTALGETVRIRLKGGNVMINESRVVATDIAASNGVVHIIDRVILPPEK